MNFLKAHHRIIIWVAVLGLIAAAFVTMVYYRQLSERPDLIVAAENEKAYMQEMQQKQLDYAKEFEGDTGGADTPDDAMRIQIEALERKDIDAASKMVTPKTREKFVSNMEYYLGKGENFDYIINAYHTGEVKSFTDFGKGHRIEISAKGDTGSAYVANLVQSPYTGKWYIVEK